VNLTTNKRNSDSFTPVRHEPGSSRFKDRHLTNI